MKVQLFTADGVGVVTEPLAIPEFNQYPDVILWGSRVFVFDAKSHKTGEPQPYVEAFAYGLPNVLDSAKVSVLASDGA